MHNLFLIITLILSFIQWVLIGQGILWMLIPNPENKKKNPIYNLFYWTTWPIMRLSRIITPKFIHDSHIGFIAFFLIIVLRIGTYMLFHSQGWIETNV